MQIQEVTISGFRSFGRSQTCQFVPGLNMIVGPEGCGKSTLIESLLWATGQIDPYGSDEDLRFKGAASLRPAGQILVCLTMAKDGNTFPLSRFASKNQSLSHYRLGEESAPITEFLEQFQNRLPTIRLVQDRQTLFALAQQNPRGETFILDEIDREMTPDETTSFARLLEFLGENNQLIVVTHSKTTMALADHVLGVTMADYGISKVFPMRLRSEN